MAELKDSAFLLRRVAYGDTSYILHLLGREHGRFTLMARGARRPKSPFRATLEPLHELHLRWHAGRTGMGTLTDVERGDALFGDERGLEGLQLSAIAEQMFRDGDPHGFDELRHAFQLLAGRAPREGMLAGAWLLLNDSGLIGPLDHCWHCARAEDVLAWRGAELRCSGCGGGESLNAGLRRAIPALMASATVRMSKHDLTTWQGMIQDVLRQHGMKPMNVC